MLACLLAITAKAVLLTEGLACILWHQDPVTRQHSTAVTWRACSLENDVSSTNLCQNSLTPLSMQSISFALRTSGMTPCAVLNAVSAALLSDQW